jgi:hypothetical protein
MINGEIKSQPVARQKISPSPLLRRFGHGFQLDWKLSKFTFMISEWRVKNASKVFDDESHAMHMIPRGRQWPRPMSGLNETGNIRRFNDIRVNCIVWQRSAARCARRNVFAALNRPSPNYNY